MVQIRKSFDRWRIVKNNSKCSLPSHIARTSDNLVVVIESTAGQVPSMTWEFSANSYISFPSFKTIDGTNII